MEARESVKREKCYTSGLKGEEGDMSRGTRAASRNYKKQGKGFSLKPSRRNAALLTAWVSASETHFKLLASRTVRLFCVLIISY